MSDGLVIWGAKGHALVLAEFAPASDLHVAVLVDRDPAVVSPLPGIEVLTGDAALVTWLDEHPGSASWFAVAIGGSRGADRRSIHEQLVEAGLRPATLVHPTAYVASDAVVGAGSQVLAQSCVGASATLGRQCIVNTAASVDHECVLGDGAHVGPGATLAGAVHLGTDAFVGAGAVILPNLRVGEGATVGAGAVVTADVPDGATVAGNPARPL
ncbi:acetyltransferase [Aquihabitans daechungensis]|uniref:acetyltransferase n=1 Tax=Aquihabitans daechungensis TaxID=1052257 RepID=UPI003BA1E92F